MTGARTRRLAARVGLAGLVALAVVADPDGEVAPAAAGKQGRRSKFPPGWRWPATKATRTAGLRCQGALHALGVAHERAPRERWIATPIVVPDMRFGGLTLVPTFRKPPFVMDCRLALAIARVAPALVQLGITELRFSSIHDRRRVRLRQKRQRAFSRHSLGLAIDVFEIGLADGSRMIVDGDYWSLRPILPLANLALTESGLFRAVLTPLADPVSHQDHFHLEARVEAPPPRSRRATRRRAEARAR